MPHVYSQHSRAVAEKVLSNLKRMLLRQCTQDHASVKGRFLVDGIYYPGSAVVGDASAITMLPSCGDEVLTERDLRFMRTTNIVLSSDDEFPHGIISEDATKFVSRPRGNGSPIMCYRNGHTGNYHIAWLATEAEARDILSAKKTCLSVSFNALEYPHPNGVNVRVEHHMDHVALLDCAKDPPAFAECRVVGMLPLADISSERTRIMGATQAIWAAMRQVAANRRASADGDCASLHSPLARQANQKMATQTTATETNTTPTPAPTHMDTSPDTGSKPRIDIKNLIGVFSSNDPDASARAKKVVEDVLASFGIPVNMSPAEIMKIDAAESLVPAEERGQLVMLKTLYDEASRAPTPSTPPAPADAAPKADAPTPTPAQSSNSAQNAAMERMAKSNHANMQQYANEISSGDVSNAITDALTTIGRYTTGEAANAQSVELGAALQTVMAYSSAVCKKRQNQPRQSVNFAQHRSSAAARALAPSASDTSDTSELANRTRYANARIDAFVKGLP